MDDLECVAILFAEAARPEPHGKSTLIGFYGVSPYVQLRFPALPSSIDLAAIFIFSNNETSGTYSVEIEVRGPSGVMMARRPGPEALHKQPKMTSTIALTFQGLPIPAVGRYSFELFTGAKRLGLGELDVILQ